MSFNDPPDGWERTSFPGFTGFSLGEENLRQEERTGFPWRPPRPPLPNKPHLGLRASPSTGPGGACAPGAAPSPDTTKAHYYRDITLLVGVCVLLQQLCVARMAHLARAHAVQWGKRRAALFAGGVARMVRGHALRPGTVPTISRHSTPPGKPALGTRFGGRPTTNSRVEKQLHSEMTVVRNELRWARTSRSVCCSSG